MTETAVPRGRTHGPHPGAIALVSLLMLVAGLVVGGALSAGATLASPFDPTDLVAHRLRAHPDGVRTAAFFQLASAVPLGIYAAVMYNRQLRLGIHLPGPVIGFFGGLTASFALLVSAFAEYVLSRPEVTVDPTLTHALSFLSFVSGGVGYVVGLGLLVAGVAVPAYLLRLTARWFAAVGLALALLAELSSASMILEPLQYLLPVGRFAGMVWLVAAGFWLPSQRPGRGGSES